MFITSKRTVEHVRGVVLDMPTCVCVCVCVSVCGGLFACLGSPLQGGGAPRSWRWLAGCEQPVRCPGQKTLGALPFLGVRSVCARLVTFALCSE